jgi:uncharacterized protein (DUF58 family)
VSVTTTSPAIDGDQGWVVPEAAGTDVPADRTAVAPPPDRWRAPDEVAPPRWADVRAVARNLSRRLGIRVAGWVMLGGGVLLLVAGGLLAWTEPRVAGVGAIAMVLVALLFTLGRPSLAVTLQVPAKHVVVGQRVTGDLAGRNVGGRRTLPGRIDLPIGDQIASIGMPSLAANGEFAQSFVIPTERRSVVTIGPALSVQGDPFGFTGRESLWTDELEVFVHPRTVNLPGRQTGFVHDLEGHTTQKLSNSDMSFHALREYVPGDDRRHIHWRSSARTGDLMVRQFEETRQSRIAIAVDLSDQSYGADEEFEDAVSVAASFVQQSFREENPISLVTNVEDHRGLTATRVMNELSRVERLDRTHVTELFRLVRDREATASIVVLVTGSRVRIDRLRRAATLLGIDTRVILVRLDPRRPLTVETVSNVTAIQLPSLDELPRAVRRAAA